MCSSRAMARSCSRSSCPGSSGFKDKQKSPVIDRALFSFPSTGMRSRSVVAIDLLTPFVAFLRLNRQGGDRPGIQPFERDGLAGFLAEAVRAVLDPAQRRVDLGDQLALAVAGAQFQLALGLGGGTIREIGMWYRLGLQVLDGFAAFLEDFVFPEI